MLPHARDEIVHEIPCTLQRYGMLDLVMGNLTAGLI